MSAIEKLTPQDFGRELDIALFSKWKSAYNDAYIQGMFNPPSPVLSVRISRHHPLVYPQLCLYYGDHNEIQ